MEPLRIGLAGLGTVGAGVLRLLNENGAALKQRCGRAIEVTAISARSRGKDRGIDISGLEWFDDPSELAASEAIDVFVELIGGEEARRRRQSKPPCARASMSSRPIRRCSLCTAPNLPASPKPNRWR